MCPTVSAYRYRYVSFAGNTCAARRWKVETRWTSRARLKATTSRPGRSAASPPSPNWLPQRCSPPVRTRTARTDLARHRHPSGPPRAAPRATRAQFEPPRATSRAAATSWNCLERRRVPPARSPNRPERRRVPPRAVRTAPSDVACHPRAVGRPGSDVARHPRAVRTARVGLAHRLRAVGTAQNDLACHWAHGGHLRRGARIRAFLLASATGVHLARRASMDRAGDDEKNDTDPPFVTPGGVDPS